MDIQSASVKTSLAGTREEAAVRIQALGLSAMKDQSAALAKLMESARVMSLRGAELRGILSNALVRTEARSRGNL
ncbi:MAG: hypothetical protein LBG57_10260 [Treponema sp.]|nr:hypothetical protein [Treponema sp.]